MKTRLLTGMFVSMMFILLIASIGSSAQEANYSNNIFPIEQVKHGMTGYGISDLGPDVSNRFKFRVEFVEKNALGYGHDIIWALLSDNPMLSKKDIGVIAGMSGSPCYSSDGRLLGTVSYSYGGSLEPMAGITPANEVLSVGKNKSSSGSISNSPSGSFSVQDNTNSRLNLMCFNINGGLSRHEDIKRFFVTKPAFSNSGGQGPGTDFSGGLKIVEMTLKAGDSIGVGLVIGDISIVGSGTIAFVDGKNVWAFGHSMFQLGEVSFPMLAAETWGAMLAQPTSWKNTTTGAIIGTFTQDRLTGVYGHLGQMPDMIPIAVNLERNGKKQTLLFYVIRQESLTPVLVKAIIDNLLTEFSDSQELSIFSKGEICIRGVSAKSFYFSEHGEGLVGKMGSYYAREIRTATIPKDNFFEKNDPDESLRIESVNIDLSVSEDDKTFDVKEIKSYSDGADPKSNYALDVIVILKNGQEQKIVSFSLFVPREFSGEIVVLAGNVEAMVAFSEKESSRQNAKSSDQQDDFSSLVRDSFSGGSLYIKIFYISKTSSLESSATLRPIIRTEIYEVILDNVVVEGQKYTRINVDNIK